MGTTEVLAHQALTIGSLDRVGGQVQRDDREREPYHSGKPVTHEFIPLFQTL